MKEFFHKHQTFILAILTLGTCFVVITIVLFNSQEKDVQLFVLGALTATISQVVSYYFGSSTGSKDKQKRLDELQDKND